MSPVSPLGSELDRAIDRIEHALRPLAGQRLFLTGGTGFVGLWLLEVLVWANRRLGLGVQITVLSREPRAFSTRVPHLLVDGHVDAVVGDVREFSFPRTRFDAVIHGAASSDNLWNRSHPGDAVDTIVSGTIRTLAFAEECHAGRFLFLSSGAVYGRRNGESALGEDHAGAPPIEATSEAAYGQAKRVAEVLTLLAAGRGLEAVVSRIFSTYGPYLPMSTHFAIGNFIRDALLGRPVTVRGDGSPVRTYIYGADLAIGLLSCLTRGLPGRAYNMGGAEPTTLAELARLVARVARPPVPVEFLEEAVPSDWYVPDMSRARDELGFVPAVTLQEGIRATMAWAREAGVVT